MAIGLFVLFVVLFLKGMPSLDSDIIIPTCIYHGVYPYKCCNTRLLIDYSPILDYSSFLVPFAAT